MSDLQRQELLDQLFSVGRSHSDVAVLLFDSLARQMGLSASDAKALGVLERSGPLGAGELAEQIGLSAASVTTLVDRLEKKDFVERTRDPDDRRRVIIAARPEKLEEAQTIFAPLFVSVQKLFERYSEQELETILDFLTQDRARMRKLLEEFRNSER